MDVISATMSTRIRPTVAMCATIAGLVLGGCTARPSVPATETPPPTSSPSVPFADAGSPSPTVRAEPNPTGPAGETGVPDTAMIPALVGLDDYRSGKEYLPYTGPVRPCATGSHPSDSQLMRARPASGMAPPEGVPAGLGHPDVIREYVAQYRSTSAASTAMAEVRADVSRCPGKAGRADAPGEWMWTAIQTGFAGDESVLIRLDALTFRYNGSGGPPCCTSYYLAGVRQADLLVAVTSTGWELQGGSVETATRSAALALTYARALRS